MQIQINKEYEDLVYPLDQDDYQNLLNSIRNNGLWIPIIVNSRGILLDGHHRYRICKELGINPETIIRNFESDLHERLFVIEGNKNRRHLNDYQKIELELETERIKDEIETRKKNSLANLKRGSDVVKSQHRETEGRIVEKIAKKVKKGTQTVSKVKKIKEKGSDELKTKLKTGNISIDRAYQTLNRSESHTNTPKLPQGTYDIILADPPWDYDIDLRGASKNQYPTMKIDDIKQLGVPAADNTMLFLWSTSPMLEKAFSVMKAWGFTYKTNMVWVKNKIGNGFFVRGKHELLLVGMKGKMPTPETDDRPASIIEAPVAEHSKKPEQVYNIIEKMYPNRQYLELFARTKHSNKWTVWGIEAPVIK